MASLGAGDQAAKKVRHFLTWYKRNRTSHVCRALAFHFSPKTPATLSKLRLQASQQCETVEAEFSTGAAAHWPEVERQSVQRCLHVHLDAQGQAALPCSAA